MSFKPCPQCPLLPKKTKLSLKQKTNHIKPFGLQIENLVTEIQIDKTQILISTTSKTPPWLLKQPKILLNRTKYHKENTHPTIFHEEFLHFKNNRPNHIHIYTESSKNGNKVSYAAIQHNTKIIKRLPSSTSIYSVELASTLAIDLALNIITQTESTKFIIFSDSISPNIPKKKKKKKKKNLDDHLTMQLLTRLEILSKIKEIELCWIPSYIGIKGNDQADSAAKTAWKMPTDKSFKILYTDFKIEIKNFTQNKWQLRWNNTPHNKLQTIKAEIGEWKEGYRKSHREEIILSRLCIGHTDITHPYLLKQEQPPWCEGCHTSYSVKHLLIDCIDRTPKRQYYKQYERTIWTCPSRQNTSISKSSWSISKNLNLQYSIYVHDVLDNQTNRNWH